MSGRTAALTGATGLLGGNLAAHLAAEGFRVRALKRKGSAADHLRDVPVEWVEGDLDDVAAMTRCFEGADGVFHCAAAVTQTSFRGGPHARVNVTGTDNVIAAFRGAGAKRLVHTSSVVTVGLARPGEPDGTEESAWNWREMGLDDVYAETKRESELRVLAAQDSLDVVVVNPGFMLGPRDPKPSTGRLIQNLAAGRIFGWTSGKNCFVDVRDVAHGMLLAFEKGRRGERYILGGENLTYREMFAIIARELGVRGPRFGFPDAVVLASGVAGDLLERVTGREQELNGQIAKYSVCEGHRFSSAKAIRELGYQIGPLDRAARDAIAWLRAHALL